MQLDDTTVKWAITAGFTALVASMGFTWKSGRLSRDAEKSIKDCERHERILEGDVEADPPKAGLRMIAQMAYDGMLFNTKQIKAILRGLGVASASDAHRIEDEVRASVAKSEAAAIQKEVLVTARHQQLQADQARRLAEEFAEAESVRERTRRFREKRGLKTDNFGTPIPDEVVEDPFSERDKASPFPPRDTETPPPHPQARAIRPQLPFGTAHSEVNTPPKKKP